MTSRGRSTEHLASFTRQATILRKNLFEWDRTLKTTGEEWPKTLGRFNAALNQTVNLDRSIDDMMEHFVYVPLKATANAQDVPFFLSTRLETVPDTTTTSDSQNMAEETSTLELLKGIRDPIQHLAKYEKQAAEVAAEYEQNMVRY
ncbi:hypothetical protein ACA910_016527 [Epithemia clementina (nom. ined.)]